jgi:hypothetical protein
LIAKENTMSLQSDLQRAASGDDYTAIDVADWLMEQHNVASAVGETRTEEVIWGAHEGLVDEGSTGLKKTEL